MLMIAHQMSFWFVARILLTSLLNVKGIEEALLLRPKIEVLVLGEGLSTELLPFVHFLLVVDQVNQELVQLNRIQTIDLFVEILVEGLVLHLVLLLRVDRRGT